MNIESKIHFPPAAGMFLEVISFARDQTSYCLHIITVISTGNLLIPILEGRLLFNSPMRFSSLGGLQLCHKLNLK